MNAEALAQVRRLQEAARNAYHSWSKLTASKVRRDNPSLAIQMRQLEAAAEEIDLFLPEQADPLLVASAADVQRQAQAESAEQEAQWAAEDSAHMPDVEWVEPRPDMGEPGGYQEVEVVDESDIPF